MSEFHQVNTQYFLLTKCYVHPGVTNHKRPFVSLLPGVPILTKNPGQAQK